MHPTHTRHASRFARSLSITLILMLPAAAPAAPLVADNTTPKSHVTPENGRTQEDYNLPQDQWGRAYREGLRQGYDAGRIFPYQLDQSYRQGLRDGYEFWRGENEIKTRTEKLLRTRDEALQAGYSAFQERRYDEAADLFMLATELDNGDPASRLHAAQALFAVGQYEQAIPLLRRAFDLQPRLMNLRFDLREDYSNLEDFTAQLNDLRAVLAANPGWSDGYLLLGYELLHSGQRNDAHQAFKHAATLTPSDNLLRQFLKVSYILPSRPLPQTRTTPPQPTPSHPKPYPTPVQPATRT